MSLDGTAERDDRGSLATGGLDPELAPAEALYVDDVRRHLRDLPRADQARLVDVARDHLLDRPPAADREALLEAMGAPSDYAGQLRVDHRLPAHMGRWQRFRRSPRLVQAGAVLAVVVALVAFGSYRWWAGQAAELNNSCGAYRPFDGIERLEAAGRSEAIIPHRQGEELRFAVCLTTDRNVTIEDVRLPFEGNLVIRQVGVELDEQQSDGGLTGPVEPFRPFALDHGGSGSGVRFQGVWVVLHLDGCQYLSPGGGVGFDSVEVDYELLGRTRTATVELGEQITIQATGPTSCP